MLESTEKGGVRNSIHNCLTVFQHDPELSGAVAKNLLTERIDLLKPIGRKRRTGSKAMTDTDMKYIRLYLEKTYGLTSEKKIADAADLAADANSYHPIRDYLNGLVWDGKERIRCCLRHFLGADTDNYTFQSLRLFLLGAIHRAFCPGCKFEVMLCLVGGQGAGKSTFFRLLAVKDEWFSDDLRKLAVHVIIVQLPQIIGEPLVPDCQQTEESGLASPLTAYQAEHDFKFASRLKGS